MKRFYLGHQSSVWWAESSELRAKSVSVILLRREEDKEALVLWEKKTLGNEVSKFVEKNWKKT